MGLKAVFKPRSIAVIGASRDPEKVGHVIFRNLLSSFKGRVYPVNPNADEILGHRCYQRVLQIEDIVDLAIVCVKPNIANRIIEDCIKKGIKAVIVITAGYREIGGEGIRREEDLKKLIESSGKKTRIIGPNCIGVYCPSSGVDTLFIPPYKMKKPHDGRISFISQSGAFGLVILDWMAEEGVGVNKFVSYGNGTDVKESELLEFLARDRDTGVIVAYIEGVENGHEFMKALKKAANKKPVIIFKGGKCEAGKKAAASHTGSMAGSYEVFRGVLRQCNAIEAENIQEMFDYARVLATCKYPKGERVAVITNGGGMGVITADCVVRNGMKLAEFSESTVKELSKILPPYASVHNPLDLIGDATAERYRKALEIVSNDENVDSIIVITLFQLAPLSSEIMDVLAEANAKTHKPLIVCSAGGEYTRVLLRSFEKQGIPAYPTPERAVKALRVLTEYAKKKGV